MLLGQDVLKFRKLLKEALRERNNLRLAEQMRTSESVVVITRAGKKKQELAQSQSELDQERDEAIIHEMESETELDQERERGNSHPEMEWDLSKVWVKYLTLTVMCLLFLPRPLTTGVQQQVRSSSSGSRRPRCVPTSCLTPRWRSGGDRQMQERRVISVGGRGYSTRNRM